MQQDLFDLLKLYTRAAARNLTNAIASSSSRFAFTRGKSSFLVCGLRSSWRGWICSLLFLCSWQDVLGQVQREAGSVRMSLRDLSDENIRLQGDMSQRSLYVGVRLDEIVTTANLSLAFTPSPALLAGVSHLQIFLNDQQVAVIPVRPDAGGERIRREISIDPRLFVEDNWLTFRLVGHYTLDCEDSLHSSIWAELDTTASVLQLRMRPLPLQDDLGRLPAPWFDRRTLGLAEVPMVIGSQAGLEHLRTASLLASWFGVMAGERRVGFPVLRDVLPDRHAVVLVTPDMPAPPGLALPAAQGPTVRVVPHPSLPQIKLLVIQGRNAPELMTAAMGMVQGYKSLGGKFAVIREVRMPPSRSAYDAPNWVPTSRPVRLAELVDTRSALQLEGTRPGTLRVRWRTPPDLWQGPGHAAELSLRYRASVPKQAEDSLLSLSLNGGFERAWRLPVSGLADQGAGIQRRLAFRAEAFRQVSTALSGFVPRQSNTMEITLPMGMKPVAGQCAWRLESTRASVDGDSTLDFSALPHYLPMPDLAIFANTGFPFTQYADLARTAVVVPTSPEDGEIETLLALMGSFGRWTGLPAWHVSLATPTTLQTVADRDLLVLGAGEMQPLLRRWQQRTPLLLEAATQELRASAQGLQAWRGWPGIRPTLTTDVVDKVQFETAAPLAMAAGFESPLATGRSVVVLSASDAATMRSITAAILDPKLSAQLHGTLAIVRTHRIEAFDTGATYHLGSLPIGARLSVIFMEHPAWIIGSTLAALALLVGMAVRFLRKRALRRLRTA